MPEGESIMRDSHSLTNIGIRELIVRMYKCAEARGYTTNQATATLLINSIDTGQAERRWCLG